MAWYQFAVSEACGAPSRRECHTVQVLDRSLIFFGGNDNTMRHNDVHVLDTDTMRWSAHAFDRVDANAALVPTSGEVPSRRSAHASCLVDGRYLVVFGGWDGTQELGDTCSYDLATHTWKTLRTHGRPPTARHFHNVVAQGRRLFVFGGFDGEKWRSDLHALDLDTLTWNEVALDPSSPAPGARASACATVLSDGRLFVFGGYDGTTFLKDVWVLHQPRSDDPAGYHRWEEVTPMYLPGLTDPVWPPARSGHACEVLGDNVIVVGGRHPQGRFNDVWVLNLTHNVWAKLNPQGSPFKARKTHAVARVGAKLFVFGGHDGEDWLGDMHVLDLAPLLPCLTPPFTIRIPASSWREDVMSLLPPSIAAMAEDGAPPRRHGRGGPCGGDGGDDDGLHAHDDGDGCAWMRPPARAIFATVPHPTWTPALCADMLHSTGEGRQAVWPLLSNALHVPGLSAPSMVQRGDSTSGSHTLVPAGYATVTSEPPSGLPVVPEAGTDLLAWYGTLHRHGDAVVSEAWRGRYPADCITPATTLQTKSMFHHGAPLPSYLLHPGVAAGSHGVDATIPAHPLLPANPHSRSTFTWCAPTGLPLAPAPATPVGTGAALPGLTTAAGGTRPSIMDTATEAGTLAPPAAMADGAGGLPWPMAPHVPLQSYTQFLHMQLVDAITSSSGVSGSAPPAHSTGRYSPAVPGSRAGAPRGGDSAWVARGDSGGKGACHPMDMDSSASPRDAGGPPMATGGGSVVASSGRSGTIPLSSTAAPPALPHFADVEFLVEGQRIPAHRYVLASRCEYFRAMFTFPTSAASAAPPVGPITLPDTRADVFTLVLRYCYLDELPTQAEYRAIGIYILVEAQKMGLTRLSLACQRHLEATLAPSTVLHLMAVADTCNAEPLMLACLRFGAAHFDSVCLEDSFSDLAPHLLKYLMAWVKQLKLNPLAVHLPTQSWSPRTGMALDTTTLAAGASPSPAGAGGGGAHRGTEPLGPPWAPTSLPPIPVAPAANGGDTLATIMLAQLAGHKRRRASQTMGVGTMGGAASATASPTRSTPAPTRARWDPAITTTAVVRSGGVRREGGSEEGEGGDGATLLGAAIPVPTASTSSPANGSGNHGGVDASHSKTPPGKKALQLDGSDDECDSGAEGDATA